MRETICLSSFRRYSRSPSSESSPLVHSPPLITPLSKKQPPKFSPSPGVFCYYSGSDSDSNDEKESEISEPFLEGNCAQSYFQPEVEIVRKKSRNLESNSAPHSHPAYLPSSLSEIFEVAGLTNLEEKIEFNAFDHRILDIRFTSTSLSPL
jgi:hypothetical protein